MLWCSLAAASSAGEPYTPSSDDEVLETLPRLVLSATGELNVKRRQLRANPDNAKLAAEVASGYVALASATGEPRYDGYARAALRRWWDADDAPNDILRLRAKINERDHDYDAAVTDLERVLAADPLDVQAWIEVANLRRVQGRYDEARSACDTLAEFAAEVPVVVARAPLWAATGKAQAAYDQLEAVRGEVASRWTGTLPWLLTMQAEIARGLGHNELAERRYREALEVAPEDFYLLRAYADFLLDHDRPGEVVPMLTPHVADTGILLRAAIAAQRSGDESQAQAWRSQLADRFEEIRLRGGTPHGRFESRFRLELTDDPEKALGVALENWGETKGVSRPPARARGGARYRATRRRAAGDRLPPYPRHRGRDAAGARREAGVALRRVVSLVCVLGCLLVAINAHAHKPSDSYLTVEAGGEALTVSWDIALKDLEVLVGLDLNQDGDITWGELKSQRSAVEAHVLSRLEITADGEPCELQVDELLVTRHGDGAYAVLVISTGAAGDVGVVGVEYSLLFDTDPTHRGLVRFVAGDTMSTHILTPESPTAELIPGETNLWHTFVEYVREGVWHIWIGFDHILFLLTLLFPAVYRRREKKWEPVESFRPACYAVLKIVTVFTVAHSITLWLAVMEYTTMPARLGRVGDRVVDRGHGRPRTCGRAFRRARAGLIALGFGLVHGFGFANVLHGPGAGATRRWRWRCSAFNVGRRAGADGDRRSGSFRSRSCFASTGFYRHVVFRGGLGGGGVDRVGLAVSKACVNAVEIIGLLIRGAGGVKGGEPAGKRLCWWVFAAMWQQSGPDAIHGPRVSELSS